MKKMIIILFLMSSFFINVCIVNAETKEELEKKYELFSTTDGKGYEYDITNKKIISKFNPNIKFNEGQLVTSIGINKNN
jgi:hypothetical protein